MISPVKSRPRPPGFSLQPVTVCTAHQRRKPHGSRVQFRWVKAPTRDGLSQLTHTIAWRIARYLERQGLLERDVEGAWLTSSAGDEEDEAAIQHLLGSSLTYRIAFGPQQGRKVLWKRALMLPILLAYLKSGP